MASGSLPLGGTAGTDQRQAWLVGVTNAVNQHWQENNANNKKRRSLVDIAG
jgi:hypothetical protein